MDDFEHQDVEPIQLNKAERDALEALHRFTSGVLEGRPCDFKTPDLTMLKKMGIDITLIPSKNVKKTKRGKSAAFTRYIGGFVPVSHMRGMPYRCYMPFQIREMKNAKNGT